MQDIIQKLISEHAAGWQTKLQEKLGFGSGQARGFVQGLIEKTIGAVSSGKLDLGSIASGLDVTELLKKVDLGRIAQQAGVDRPKAEEGLQALAPELSSALGQAVSGGDLTQGLLEKSGGLLGKTTDSLSGLFGK